MKRILGEHPDRIATFRFAVLGPGPLRHALGSAALALATLGCVDRVPAGLEREAELHFLDHLASLEVVLGGPQAPQAVLYEIDYDQRPALYQPAPSIYRLRDLPSGPSARLETAMVMAPASWTGPSDGVELEVLCLDPNGSPLSLAHSVLDPVGRPGDRRWLEIAVGLEGCSVPTTDLELRTSCGPHDNCAADYAAWGDPRIVHRQQLVLRPRQIVLLVSIDTLRADRLGLYGAPRSTSPALDRLGADAIVFEQAFASSPWTIPSHGTLLTSTDPRVHGATAETAMTPTVGSLAEAFQRSGWQTAGFVDTPYLRRSVGFARGFDHFDDEPSPNESSRRGARLVRERVVRWLDGADERPAFVFWHVMDVHGPYGSPAPHGGRFRRALEAESPGARPEKDHELERLAPLRYHDYLQLERFSSLPDLIAAYDEGISAVDEEVGALVDLLRAHGAYDEALIVVTSDHGESFMDHDLWIGHGLFLADDEVRVPLIVKRPGGIGGGTRASSLVGLIDVAPSILDLLGLPIEASMQGRRLFSSSLAGAAGDAIVFGYSNNVDQDSVRTPVLTYFSAARRDAETILQLHLRGPRPPPRALLELLEERIQYGSADAVVGFRRPDGASNEEQLVALRALVAQHVAASADLAHSIGAEAPLEESDRERLKALGYVH